MRQRADDAGTQRFVEFAELPLHLAHGLRFLLRGFSVDQIGQTLRFHQIHFAVCKCPAREFTGIGRTQAHCPQYRQKLANHR